MAEFSWPWPNTVLGYDPQIGDGRKITAEEQAELFLAMFGPGVVPVGNMLAVTSPGANQLSVNTGYAIIAGRFYINPSAAALAPASAGAGSTRKDSVVLECDWNGSGQTEQYTTRVVTLEGTAGAYPTLTQTPNVLWQERLYNYIINDAGVISSLSDQRAYSHFRTLVDEDMLDASIAGNGLSGGAGSALAVNVDDSTIEINADALRVKDGGITAGKIANRTRSFLVQPQNVYNQTNSVEIAHGDNVNGWPMTDAKIADVYGTFQVPQDFASGMTVKALVNPAASGNIVSLLSGYYCAEGENLATHSASSGAAAPTALTASILAAINSIALASASAGDFVSLMFSRVGSDGNDTINNTVYFLGFLISYTADS